MAEALKIPKEIKQLHRERVDKKIEAVNAAIKIAMDKELYSTDFVIMREDPDYAEIKNKYIGEGYHFMHKTSRWNGNEWVDVELICW